MASQSGAIVAAGNGAAGAVAQGDFLTPEKTQARAQVPRAGCMTDSIRKCIERCPAPRLTAKTSVPGHELACFREMIRGVYEMQSLLMPLYGDYLKRKKDEERGSADDERTQAATFGRLEKEIMFQHLQDVSDIPLNVLTAAFGKQEESVRQLFERSTDLNPSLTIADAIRKKPTMLRFCKELDTSFGQPLKQAYANGWVRSDGAIDWPRLAWYTVVSDAKGELTGLSFGRADGNLSGDRVNLAEWTYTRPFSRFRAVFHNKPFSDKPLHTFFRKEGKGPRASGAPPQLTAKSEAYAAAVRKAVNDYEEDLKRRSVKKPALVQDAVESAADRKRKDIVAKAREGAKKKAREVHDSEVVHFVSGGGGAPPQ